jgi:hypothetical protein
MTVGKWSGRLVIVLAAAVGLALTIHSCRFDRRCLTNTHPDHCDGFVAVACEGGRGSLPLVRHDDCRKATAGPGICVETSLDDSGRHFVSCLTPCDPAAYVPHCDSNAWTFNCVRHGSSGTFHVVNLSCTEAIGCEMRVARSGKREAICRGDLDYSRAGSEPSPDANIPRGSGGRQ